MNRTYTLSELSSIIAPIARKHGVKRISVFGSYGRNQATVKSDVDLHIEKGQVETLLQIISFQQDVEDALQTRVDVVTSDTQDKGFLTRIQKDEVTLYAEYLRS